MKNFYTLRKTFLLLTVGCLMGAVATAAPIGKQRAQQIAAQAMGGKSLTHRAPSADALQVETVFDAVNELGQPYLYAVSNGTEGFVLVSGDDRYAEVLGYSDSGAFNAANMPDNMRGMLKGYIEEMKALDAKGYAPEKTGRRAAQAWAAVKPLTTTRWYQMAPYSNNLPKVDGVTTITGCGPTSISQLLYYWGKKTGKPSEILKAVPAYTTKTHNFSIPELPVTTFDWTKMKDTYTFDTPEAEAIEVAKLCQYVACAMQTDFKTFVEGGSPSNSTDIIPTLIDYFGFDKTIWQASRFFYTTADWDSLVYNELSHQRPVLYSSDAATPRPHLFLIDGYDGNGMFHVNWGWAGRSEGYFLLSVLDPLNADNKNAPVTMTSYQQGVSAFISAQIGLTQPAEGGKEFLVWNEVKVENGQMTATTLYLGGEKKTYDYGLAWLGADGALEVIKSETKEFEPWDPSDPKVLPTPTTISYTPQATDKPAGIYKIVAISRLNGTETWVADKMKCAIATFDGTTVKVVAGAPALSATFAFNDSKKATYTQDVDITVKNDGQEFTDELYFFVSTTEEKGKAAGHTRVPIEENSTKLVSMSFLPETAGTYNVWLTLDEAGTKVLGQSSVVIAEASDPVITFEATNKPTGVGDMTVKSGETVIPQGGTVARDAALKVITPEVFGYHLEWWINGVKMLGVTGGTAELGAVDDMKIEARYVENFKLIFKGTPYVKYADANGIIYMGPNFYNHKFEKLRAFGYSVGSYTGSNGKPYYVDNSPDLRFVMTDTLTADVELTPNYVLNQADLGDATVMPVWEFDNPDSVVYFNNFQGKSFFVKPTWIESGYIDLNMTVDATDGWIDNDPSRVKGYANVGSGTKFTLPARYGTIYRMTTKEPLTATTIADSTAASFRKSVDKDGNQIATLLYNGSDADSIRIMVNEDIKLVSISASYPGGDNVLTWLPDTTATNTKDELVTMEKTGEAGCLLYDLSDLTLNGGLKVVGGTHRDSCSVQIEVPNEKDENKYLSTTFQMGDGFSFALKRLLTQMVLEGADKSAKVEIVLSDERGTQLKSKVYEHVKTDLVFTDSLENLGKTKDLHMEGKITMKLYVYGAADYYRLYMPITCSVEICEVMRFPEGYNYATFKAKSEIDNDGAALLTVDCYELVGVDDEHDHVILNPIEEIPMGDVLIIHSDEAGAVHHIPLTRADDAYVRGNNRLWVSDGTVKGGKDIYRFSKEGDQYVFRSSSADVTLPRGEIYMKFHSTTKKEVFYLNEKSVPEQTSELVFHEDEDNSPLIEQYKGRDVKKVVLDGHTLYKNHMWNTICLPFDIIGENMEASPLQGAEIHEMDLSSNGDYNAPTGYDAETGVVTLNFKSVHAIEPGKPYFLEWRTTVSSEIVNPEFTNVTIKTTPAAEMAVTSNDGKVRFSGTYNPVMLTGSNIANLYVGNDDKIHVPAEHVEVGAFQGYFLIDLGNGFGVPGSNPLNNILLNIAGGDDVLRVINITVPQHLQDGAWYDLQGRRYTDKPTAHGIYIMNGKKILIK